LRCRLLGALHPSRSKSASPAASGTIIL
jgi:hypothetical protein